jgi:hypothetical protein
MALNEESLFLKYKRACTDPSIAMLKKELEGLVTADRLLAPALAKPSNDPENPGAVFTNTVQLVTATGT